MPDPAAPLHHFFIDWYKEILATLLIAFGVVYKYGKQEAKIKAIADEQKEQGEEINETQGLMEAFHGKCDDVNTTLQQTVTRKDLKSHCKESQQHCTTNLCRKIEDVKAIQKESTKELKNVNIFMSRIEEQHKMDVILRKDLFIKLEKINEIQQKVVQEVAILKKSKV